MRTIYTIGESLLDIIFENNEPVTAKPGGSLLNTSMSLAKAGNKVSLISELGNDYIAELIGNRLKNAGINTNNIQLYSENKTSLALAFLDENKNANYSFYKNFPENRKLTEPQIGDNDILMFGSIYSITHEIRSSLLNIVSNAKHHNALICYDPNIRKHTDIPAYQSLILENISYSDIVKASDEDIYTIWGNISYQELYQKISDSDCKNLIITRNKNKVLLFTQKCQMEIEVPEIKVISTIGAGDAFNAGIIHEISKQNIDKNNISETGENKWKKIIESGIAFASDVCMSYENSISDEFAQKQ